MHADIFLLCEDNFFQLIFVESTPLYDEYLYQEDFEETKRRSLSFSSIKFFFFMKSCVKTKMYLLKRKKKPLKAIMSKW